MERVVKEDDGVEVSEERPLAMNAEALELGEDIVELEVSGREVGCTWSGAMKRVKMGATRSYSLSCLLSSCCPLTLHSSSLLLLVS